MANEKGRSEAIPERQQRALEMRKAGLNYREIGKALDVSYTTVFNDVRAAIARINKDNDELATEVKKLEIERLDTALKSIYPAVLKGDLHAIDRLIKIMERRSRFEGLDAPTKQEMDIIMPEPIKFVPAPERVDE